MSNQISLKDNFINDKARWESFQQSLLGLYGKDMVKKPSDEVSSALKGPKGTTIVIKVERNGH